MCNERIKLELITTLIAVLFAGVILACGGGSAGNYDVGIIEKTGSVTGQTTSGVFKVITTELQSPVVDVSYEMELEASGGTEPYSWSITMGALPEGLSLDASTGIISGIPQVTGWSEVTFTATDQDEASTSADFLVEVTALDFDVTTETLPDGTYEEDYTTAISATGGKMPYRWSITSGTLLAGLSLDGTTGIISGTPTEYGTANITVTVKDALETALEMNYSLVVNIATLEISSTMIAGGTYNIPYSSNVVAAGGVPPYTFAITAGVLPAGLALDPATGVISGTPTVSTTESITLSVTDSLAAVTTKDFDVTIGGIYISNSSLLTDATTYIAYTAALVAAGDAGPYTWSISAGALPDGFSLDSSTGEISGTTIVRGDYSFTVNVTNGTYSSSREFFLQVLGDFWVTTSSDPPNCPEGRGGHTAVWTGETGVAASENKMIVWGGYYNNGAGTYVNTGGVYDSETNKWTATSTAGDCPGVRWTHTAVWTGDTGNAGTENKMIIWGGRNPGVITYNDGGIYDPATDTWAATSTLGNCPVKRFLHVAVWTGDTGNAATSNRMIVWSGNPGGGQPVMNSGGIYDPATDTWTATSTDANCPQERSYAVGFWTGNTGNPATANRMIVWGGINGVALNTGGIYDPATDSWTPTSTAGNCPIGKYYFTGVWTGDTGNAATSYRMIVWGGYNGGTLNTGGIYNPATDSWTATSTGADCPVARLLHTCTWTGTTMIVWGGDLNTGGVYDLLTDTWKSTSVGDNCPTLRRRHTAVWTGTNMIVWGGLFWDGGAEVDGYDTGAMYTP